MTKQKAIEHAQITANREGKPMQIRLIDVTRTGECFGTWLFTDRNDYRSGRQCFEHPTMPRKDALDYWRARGFSAIRRNAHEYWLERPEDKSTWID